MDTIVNATNIAILGVTLGIIGMLTWWLLPQNLGKHWPIRMMVWGALCLLTGLALKPGIDIGWSTLLFILAGVATVCHVSYIRKKNDSDDEYSEGDKRHPVFGLVSVAILSVTALAYFHGNVLVLASLTLGWISMLGILLEKSENWWAPRMGLWSFVVFLGYTSVDQSGSAFGIIWMVLLWIAGITHISILKSRENEGGNALHSVQIKLWGLVTIAMVALATLQYFNIVQFREVFETSLTQN